MTTIISQLAHSRRHLYHTLAKGDYPLYCNGIPKAGTHLLLNILRQLPKFEDYERRTHHLYLNQGKVDPAQSNTLSDVRKRMRGCYPGEIMKVHLAYEPSLANVMRETEAKHVVMVRDPRAIVLSMADWWDQIERPDLWAWRYYRALPNRDEQIKFLIEGWPEFPKGDFPKDVPFPDLGARMRQFTPWLHDCQTMVVRYEDFMSPRRRAATLSKLVAYLMRGMAIPQQKKIMARLEKGMAPEYSKTYTAGEPLRWRRELSAQQIAMCQHYAGAEIKALGYTLLFD